LVTSFSVSMIMAVVPIFLSADWLDLSPQAGRGRAAGVSTLR